MYGLQEFVVLKQYEEMIRHAEQEQRLRGYNDIHQQTRKASRRFRLRDLSLPTLRSAHVARVNTRRSTALGRLLWRVIPSWR